MAINPAPMDQCTLKARCLTGPNQGLAYDLSNPCQPGEKFVAEICDCVVDAPPCSSSGSGTLTSSVSSRAGRATITTFYPVVTSAVPSGGSRVLDGVIQVYDGQSFVDVGTVPYGVGDEYGGELITDVIHSFEVAATCN